MLLQLREYINVPINKKGNKTFLSISYNILENIILPRLTPFTDEIIGDNQ
jgi:hypothetical protein